MNNNSAKPPKLAADNTFVINKEQIMPAPDKKTVINLNGELISSKDPIFSVDNRAFRYGDGLFESVRMINGEMPLFDLHFPRLMHGCEMLRLDLDKEYTYDFFKLQMMRTAEAKGLTDNCRIRLSIYRTAGGYYLPMSNKAEFLIEVRPLTEKGFELNEKGFKIDLYSDIEKPVSKLSSFKTCNALIYVLAAIHRQKNKLDDCLLINWKSRVIESIDSNFFVVEDGVVKTPPLAEGCVEGIMRKHILSMLDEMGITSQEVPMTLEDLFRAEELFLTNAIHGIKWVEQYKSKTYKLDIAKRLSEKLNRSLGIA